MTPVSGEKQADQPPESAPKRTRKTSESKRTTQRNRLRGEYVAQQRWIVGGNRAIEQ